MTPIGPLDEREQVIVDRAVGRQHVGDTATEVDGSAVEILAAAACLLDHERTGSDIPRVRSVAFEEGVDPACGDVGEAQGGTSEHASTAGVQVECFDATGRSLVNQRASGTTEMVDLSALNSGAYLLRATTDAGTLTSRFVKR